MTQSSVLALCLLASGVAHATPKTARVWLKSPAETAHRLDALAASGHGIANGRKPRFTLTDRKQSSGSQSGGSDGWYDTKKLSFTLKQGGVARGTVEVVSETNANNPGWREEQWLTVKAPSRRAATKLMKAIEPR